VPIAIGEIAVVEARPHQLQVPDNPSTGRVLGAIGLRRVAAKSFVHRGNVRFWHSKAKRRPRHYDRSPMKSGCDVFTASFLAHDPKPTSKATAFVPMKARPAPTRRLSVLL
jgi:hypothetical protein